MGKPLPTSANPAAATPPSGDKANAVIEGTLTGLGAVTQPFTLYGAFNVALWGSATAQITTHANLTTGVLTADVNTTSQVGTLTAGQAVAPSAALLALNALLPGGSIIAPLTTIGIGGSLSMQIGGLTTAQVAGLTTAQVGTITAVGGGTGLDCTVDLERSFDGGTTWLTANIGGSGTAATYQMSTAAINNPVNFVAAEPELQVAYRLRLRAYAAGTLNYRISCSGLAAMAWGIPIG